MFRRKCEEFREAKAARICRSEDLKGESYKEGSFKDLQEASLVFN